MAAGFPWLARLAAASLLTLSPGVAQDSPALEKKDAPRFAPEIEKKFEELMTKLREGRSRDEAGQLKKEIAEIVKVTGLDDAGQKALEKPAAGAVESAVKDWVDRTETLYRTSWESNNLSPEILDQWIAQASAAWSNASTDYVKATEQPVWKEALAQALDPKQAAAWKAEVDEQRRKFEEQIKGVISATKARIREQHAQTILGMVSAVALTLSLDEERKKKLEKIAEQAADQASDSIKEKARRMMLNFDEARRKQFLKQNEGLYIAPDEKDAPEKQAVWNEGLKQILKPEEIARWEAALEKRREQRVRALAQTLVWTLEQAVTFTASQREQLQPMAEQWVRDQKGLHSNYSANTHYSVNLQTFQRAAAQGKEEDLKRILDEKQVEHWKKATSQSRTVVNRVVNPAATKAATKPEPFEPEELETAISDYLYQLAEREQDRALADALVQAEDAIRVAGVDGKAAQRLQTAARGEMETNFEAWKTSTTTNIRSQFQNATRADFQQRLANLDYDPVARRRTRSKKDGMGLWEKTVAAELTDTQRAAWQKEVDARKAYERKVIAATVLTGLDQLCALSEEQRSRLDSVLMKQLEEYGPEFDQMFSSRNTVWFLQSYYVLTPLAGIPEKDVRQILADEQWKHLSSSQQFSNATQYWSNIESNHKRRIKKP